MLKHVETLLTGECTHSDRECLAEFSVSYLQWSRDQVNLRDSESFPANFHKRDDPLSPGACAPAAGSGACVTGQQYSSTQLMVYNCDDKVSAGAALL